MQGVDYCVMYSVMCDVAVCRVVACCSFVSNNNNMWGSKYLVWTLHKQ